MRSISSGLHLSAVQAPSMVARLIIDTVLKNTNLEKHRISELIIPFPAPASNNNSAIKGDGGAGGTNATTALPPINKGMLKNLVDYLDTSTDVDLADAEEQWNVMYN